MTQRTPHRAFSFFLVVLAVAVLALGAFVLYRSRNAKDSTISLDVPNTTVSQTLTVPLRISADKAINAGEFYFSFPTNLLQVKQIVTTGSFFTLWVKDSPSFSNDQGTIYLAGGLPTPGFMGKDGLVATIIFTAKARGSGQITLNSNSQVLLNDGLGTPLPASYQPTNFSIR